MLLKFWVVNLLATVLFLVTMTIAWEVTHSFAAVVLALVGAALAFMLATVLVGLVVEFESDSVIFAACSASFALLSILAFVVVPFVGEFLRYDGAGGMMCAIGVMLAILTLFFASYGAFIESDESVGWIGDSMWDSFPSALGIAGLLLGPLAWCVQRRSYV